VGNGKEPFGESNWGLTCIGDVAAWCWEGALWGGGCWTGVVLARAVVCFNNYLSDMLVVFGSVLTGK
jgi:hypothetical protein